MSYEGCNQILCTKGHQHIYDCYDPQNPLNYEFNPEQKWKCSFCGAPMIWWSSVDQTNEEEYGRIKLEQLTAPVLEICPTCEHEHLVAPATFRIPDKGGHRLPVGSLAQNK